MANWKEAVELLRLCNTPASIISPFPIFALSLFLISRKGLDFQDVSILFAGIAVSLISNFGSNLWNHCNDLKEDLAQGKKTILTRDISMRRTALYMAILFYLSSILIVCYLSLELKRNIYIYFLIWALATWWYSDNLVLKRITGFRLKNHYTGELVTYCIAWPMYTLTIWTIYSDLNASGIIMSVAFLFFSIAGLLLKDLKDISGDRKAGLKTFGVVFFPSQLIRYSCYFMVLYYLAMLNPLTFNNISKGILIMVIPFVYFLKNTFVHMYRKGWTLDTGDLNAIKSIGNSIYASAIFIGLGGIF